MRTRLLITLPLLWIVVAPAQANAAPTSPVVQSSTQTSTGLTRAQVRAEAYRAMRDGTIGHRTVRHRMGAPKGRTSDPPAPN